MNKFLYFLLGVLSAVAVALTGTLAHQAGVLPLPSVAPSSASAAPSPAPKLIATPKHTPTHAPTHKPKPKVTHTPTHRPTPKPARTTTPASGTHDALCKDGTTTHKAGHSGACSHHGGLA